MSVEVEGGPSEEDRRIRTEAGEAESRITNVDQARAAADHRAGAMSEREHAVFGEQHAQYHDRAADQIESESDDPSHLRFLADKHEDRAKWHHEQPFHKTDSVGQFEREALDEADRLRKKADLIEQEESGVTAEK